MNNGLDSEVRRTLSFPGATDVPGPRNAPFSPNGLLFIMSEYRITFLPMEKTFPAEENETVLEVAMRSGIHINASCGGNGACGKCRIKNSGG